MKKLTTLALAALAATALGIGSLASPQSAAATTGSDACNYAKQEAAVMRSIADAVENGQPVEAANLRVKAQLMLAASC
jgi:hypothetical protein